VEEKDEPTPLEYLLDLEETEEVPKYTPKKTPEPVTKETINLGSKDIKSENDIQNVDKNVFTKYGFFMFCILLVFLLFIERKKIYKNEFRE